MNEYYSLTKEIGVSQGLCYRYYASKEEIYDAALDKYASYIAEQNRKRVKAEGLTLREQILQISGGCRNIRPQSVTRRISMIYFKKRRTTGCTTNCFCGYLRNVFHFL